MLRKDREITDRQEIVSVLKRCDTISIALHGDEYPYIVPVSFGVIEDGEDIGLYFHCAMRGKKAELLENDPRVCVEAHIFHKVEDSSIGITTRYESVIACGIAEKVAYSEALRGLKSIVEHYGYGEYSVESCDALPVTAVYKISVKSITGKKNV